MSLFEQTMIEIYILGALLAIVFILLAMFTIKKGKEEHGNHSAK